MRISFSKKIFPGAHPLLSEHILCKEDMSRAYLLSWLSISPSKRICPRAYPLLSEHILCKKDMSTGAYPLLIRAYPLQRGYVHCISFATATLEHIPSWLSISSSKRICPLHILCHMSISPLDQSISSSKRICPLHILCQLEHIPSWHEHILFKEDMSMHILCHCGAYPLLIEHILFKEDMSTAYPLPTLEHIPSWLSISSAYPLQRGYVHCISFATGAYPLLMSISSSKRICPLHILCHTGAYPLLTEHILFKEDMSTAYPLPHWSISPLEEHILFKEDMSTAYPLPLEHIPSWLSISSSKRICPLHILCHTGAYPLLTEHILFKEDMSTAYPLPLLEHIPSWWSISSSKRICPLHILCHTGAYPLLTEHILFKEDMSTAYPLPLWSISPLDWAYPLQRGYVHCISFATLEHIPSWLSISSSKRICPLHILCHTGAYPLLMEHILFKEDMSTAYPLPHWSISPLDGAYPLQRGYVHCISFATLHILWAYPLLTEHILFKEDMSTAYPLPLWSISPLDWAYPLQRGYVHCISFAHWSISPLDWAYPLQRGYVHCISFATVEHIPSWCGAYPLQRGYVHCISFAHWSISPLDGAYPLQRGYVHCISFAHWSISPLDRAYPLQRGYVHCISFATLEHIPFLMEHILFKEDMSTAYPLPHWSISPLDWSISSSKRICPLPILCHTGAYPLLDRAYPLQRGYVHCISFATLEHIPSWQSISSSKRICPLHILCHWSISPLDRAYPLQRGYVHCLLPHWSISPFVRAYPLQRGYTAYPLPHWSISPLDRAYPLQRGYVHCLSFATLEHIPSWQSISSSKRICPLHILCHTGAYPLLMEHILFKEDMSTAYPLPLWSISPLDWAYPLQRGYVHCISFATVEHIPSWQSISSPVWSYCFTVWMELIGLAPLTWWYSDDLLYGITWTELWLLQNLVITLHWKL
jgi:hypothetical protein